MNSKIKFKVYNSLQKVFLDRECIECEYVESSMMQNEIFSCIVSYRSNQDILGKLNCNIEINSPIKDCVNIRKVGHVPSMLPAYSSQAEGYLSTKPGLFPDVLEPIDNNEIFVSSMITQSIWIMINPDQNVTPGRYPVEIRLYNPESEIDESVTFFVNILPVMLPKQELIYTNWFHADCVAVAHNVDVFSEDHWVIMRNYIDLAVKYGQNMLYTPIFTPPLDTQVGNERMTVQLVDVEYINGQYIFLYDKFDRYVEMAKKCGIKYFEISHFFTQWGAKSTPKIMVKNEGVLTQKFGWQTEACSSEYKEFLNAFFQSFMPHIEKIGIDDFVFFHVSDEPEIQMLEDYRAAYNMIKEHVKNRPIIDALSSIEFLREGLVDIAIPANNHMKDFLEDQPENLWTYYCCAQHTKVSNRFIAMPSYRNRILGIQIYLYNIKGFLQWGYNFYNSGLSKRAINPYYVTDADMAFPSGDAFMVYPYENTAIESIRQIVFHEALQDLRALKLLESLKGRMFVEQLIDKHSKQTIKFDEYPLNPDFIIELRKSVNDEILKAKLS